MCEIGAFKTAATDLFRLERGDGTISEWKSKALPAYQRRTMEPVKYVRRWCRALRKGSRGPLRNPSQCSRFRRPDLARRAEADAVGQSAP